MTLTDVAVIDFETYYDSTYSLKKMSLLDYLMAEPFKVHGLAFQIKNTQPTWVYGAEVPLAVDMLRRVDLPIVSHNAMFDCGVLAYHFDYIPRRVHDTYLMTRFLGFENGSLAHLAERFKLGRKASEALTAVEGVRDPLPSQLLQLGLYCCDDVRMCRALFDRLAPLVPEAEHKLVSWTVRMFLRRSLCVDADEADQEKARILHLREEAFARVGMTEMELRHAPSVERKLNELGYRLEMKRGKRGPVPALARTDQWMREALRSDDEKLREFAQARLAAQSNIGLTRVERLQDLAVRLGTFGAQLRYYGAHTGRWSGDGAINLQNLPKRGDPQGGGVRSLLRPAPFTEEEIGA